jgi:cytochrome c oxidase subunit 2
MLLRVYVDSRSDFDAWVRSQSRSAVAVALTNADAAKGREIFEATSCINCHTVRGTVADGRFGPDLTHLMSRETIAAGAATNTPANLKLWIEDPDAIKPGSLMPAMRLTEQDLNSLTAYMETLR